jgi:hypothetical protein
MLVKAASGILKDERRRYPIRPCSINLFPENEHKAGHFLDFLQMSHKSEILTGSGECPGPDQGGNM